MAWKIRMMSGVEYLVDGDDLDSTRKALLNGGVAVIKEASIIVNGKSIEAIEEETAGNPIINDEDFKKWIEGNSRSIDILNSRFRGDKYEKQWKQALEYKKRIETGEIKLLL